MYKEILKEIHEMMWINEGNCAVGDVTRSARNCAFIEALVWVLKKAGYEIKWGTCGFPTNSECDWFAYLKINGVEMVKNGECQQAFYEAMKD